MRTLVVGATGLLGSEICRRLLERGWSVRALVRPFSPAVSRIARQGVEMFAGDLKDPRSLTAACAGVDAVVSTASTTISRARGDTLKAVDRDGQLALLTAAQRQGVGRYLYVSVSPNLPETSLLVQYKRTVERAVKNSAIPWTVLQPSCFMEIWFGAPVGWDVARGRATIFGNGRAPVSWISLEDVAEFAVLSLGRKEAEGRALPLGGPQALTPLDAVRVFERVTGRRFQVRHVPAWVLRSLSRVLRSVSPIRSSILALGAALERGDAIDMTGTLREFGVRPTTLQEFAASRDGAPRMS